jgi:NitT/TauT family transport system permease protein
MSDKRKNIALKIWRNRQFRFAVGTVFFILLWWFVALSINQEIILPTPWQTISALPDVFGTPNFFGKVWATVWRTLLGFFLSFVLGAAAALLSLKPAAEDLFRPLVSFLRSMPTLVLTIFLVRRFGEDGTPVVIGMMMTFPVVYTGLLTALKNVDKNLLEMAQIYKVSRRKVTGVIYYRSVLPYVFSAAENSLGMSFKVVVSTEVLITPFLSIGREIQSSQSLYLISQVFAWIVMVLVITLLLELVVSGAKRLLVKW